MEHNRKEDRIYSLIPAFSFRVSFSGGIELDNIPFAEVSGIRVELPYEEVWDGGVNNVSYKLPKQIKLDNLVLKRGAIPHPDKFVEWCEKAIYYFDFNPCSVSVMLVDGDTQIKGWEFKNAYPVKFETSTLDAVKNEIVVETVELVYSEIKTIPSPETEKLNSIVNKTIVAGK